MYKFYPYYTNDGSVGLYSPEVDDIYHSTYGALTEAYEKFLLPSHLNYLLKNKKEIKLLDICFGIGYNTKTFINEIIKFYYNDTIYTNNTTCNEQIYGDNIFPKIYIHAIDSDKNLPFLSPFFITDKKNIKHNNLSFNQEKISKMLGKTIINKYKLKKETEYIFYSLLEKLIPVDTIELLENKKYCDYFDHTLVDVFKHFIKSKGIFRPNMGFLSFLHNIYYKYISKSNKMAQKCLKNLNFEFNLDIDDARVSLVNDSNTYNLIFLDAFTPVKCPCLWTLEFFKELYKHLDEDGMILTYSNSAQVRNAFLNAGFQVGKIYSENYKKYSGTIAVKDKSLIKTHLSEYDLGLIKTKAGIFYRDENLNLANEAIISAHNFELNNSSLDSSSKFIKQYKKEHQNEKI